MRATVMPAEKAVGMPLSHDLTEMDPRSGKRGARFRRGHILRDEDVPKLLAMGKANLSILELEPGEAHEDEAALELANALAGDGVEVRGPHEGKCLLVSERKGLFCLDHKMVDDINADEQMVLATIPPWAMVEPGEKLVGARVMPLAIGRNRLEQAINHARPVCVLPFRPLNVGLVTTGSEILQGRIADGFAPVLRERIEPFAGRFIGQELVGDDRDRIAAAISHFLAQGADLVVCTGGMSVDADDVTPGAIRAASSEVIFKGVPCMPGSNLMLARAGAAVVVGAPACVVMGGYTAFDTLMLRLFAGVVPTGREVRGWGVGGLCRNCSVCVFPGCHFGNRP